MFIQKLNMHHKFLHIQLELVYKIMENLGKKLRRPSKYLGII